MAELFVGGEGLRRGARDVLGTLLHEAAHGMATARSIKDTSRQGRYHNRCFAELAHELGITVAVDGARGWSATTLPDDTATDYTAELARLGEAITPTAVPSPPGVGTTTTSRNNPPALCGCAPPRRIWVARAVLAAGPIVCGCCETKFTVDEPEPDSDSVSGGDPDGGEGGGMSGRQLHRRRIAEQGNRPPWCRRRPPWPSPRRAPRAGSGGSSWARL